MRLRFGLTLAGTLAVVGGYLAFTRPVPLPRGAVAVAPTPPGDSAATAALAVGAAVSPAAGAPQAPARPVNRAAARATASSDRIEARVRRLAAREPYRRDELRRVLERTLAGKLGDHELGSADYERLTDALLRLRAALRVLRGLDESPATAAIRDEQRQTIAAVFAEVEALTGLPPAELGALVTVGRDDEGDAPPP